MGSRWLGPYFLLKLLGRGGMGDVYLALHRTGCGVERLVAVKTINDASCSHPSFVELFMAEARLTATLTHPHIAQVYDAGYMDGQHFLVMEFVDGPTMRHVFRHPDLDGLPLPVALTLADQLCSALGYAHEKCDLLGTPLGIVHRDVSPDNVILDRQGFAKLCDFGIAKSTLEFDDGSSSATWKGKKGYMSPEQCENHRIDPRSDVFGLGILLWEMVAGQRLFTGDSQYKVMKKILEDPIPDLTSVCDCPEELSKIVGRALRRDPDERWQRIADLQRTIGELVREGAYDVGTLAVREFVQETFPDESRDEIALAMFDAGSPTEVTKVETAS